MDYFCPGIIFVMMMIVYGLMMQGFGNGSRINSNERERDA